MTFSVDAVDLTVYPYSIAARSGWTPPPRPGVLTPYGSRAGAALALRSPGVRPLTYTIGVEGTTAEDCQDNLDALMRVIARQRVRLVDSFTDGRFAIVSIGAPTLRSDGPIFYEVDLTFETEDAYLAAAAPSADVRTPTLALLPQGAPVYGIRFSLTPGGSAPALPRILLVNQAGGVTPISWRVTNLSTGGAIATTGLPETGVPAGSLLRLDKRGAFVSSMSSSVLGYWPLCDAASPFRDFSSNGRDLTAATSTTLNTDLISFWKLDEASGTRNDSIGTNHLTDNNTVTQAAGKVGNAAQFTAANSESLSIADNAALSLGADVDFTWAGWVYLASKPGTMVIFDKRTGTNPQDSEYSLFYVGGVDRFLFRVGNGTSGADATANTFGSPATATWYFVACWHDKTANTVNISVNNGTADSTAWTGGTQDTAATLYFGRSSESSIQFWDGRLDAWGFWKRALSGAERTELNNGGSGLETPFGSGGAAVTYLADGPDAPPDGVAMDAAAGFDGTANGYADSSVAALGATGSLTLMGWVYLTSVSSTRVFASKASTNNGYSVGLAGGVFRAQAGNGATTRTLDGYSTAEVNRWYFVALQVTSTRCRLWVATLDLPPVLEDQETGLVLTAGTNNFRLGAGHQVSDGTAYPTAGRLSEWMVVNSEIAQSALEAAWRNGPAAWNEVAADFEGDLPALVPRPLTTNVIELRADHATTAPTPRVATIYRSRWE